MFQEIYPAATNISPMRPTGFYHYKYIIYDSDFTEVWTGLSGQQLFNTLVRAGAIINCYEYKKQNVAYNLALYHKHMMERYNWYNLEDEIKYNIQWTPKYSIYVSNVNKYLSRMDKLKAFW